MPQKACICLFSALYFPSVGGVETYTANLAEALTTLGYRVIVVTTSAAAREKNDTSTVEIVRLPSHELLAGRYPVPKKNARAREIWAWLDAQAIDHVVVNTRFYPLSIAALAFAQKQGVVPVLIEHGSAHLTLGNSLADKVLQIIEHSMTTRAKRYPARYYAVSHKASMWLSHFDIASKGELSNSIDADACASKESSRDFRKEHGWDSDVFLVAFVGRLVKEKGVLDLARAAKELEEENFGFIIAGDGPELEALSSFRSDRLQLPGKLNQSEVTSLLSQANVLCLPSRSEGFATTLLEAAACNTPAVVTDVGGVDELIPDEDYGIVLPSREPLAIVQALRTAAENPQHTSEQGRNVGRLVRAEYSWQRTAQKVIEACQAATTL